jgi:hypothetical protein
MGENALSPAWPRLSAEDTAAVAAQLLVVSSREAIGLVSTNVEGYRFYATAPARVNKTMLDGLRDSIVALAKKHGFPNERLRRAQPTFDQELAVLAANAMPMLPVEASDEEIWSFLTLKVVPDVAIWRWPQAAERDPASDEEVAADPRASRLERLIGGRRGMLRQAWWRSFLLGEDACLVLNEDNFIQLTDRISLTGDRRVGGIIVKTHLAMQDRSDYDARNGLRRAMVLVGRLHGRLAVEALSDDDLRDAISQVFEQASDDIRSGKIGAATPPIPSPDEANVVERFLRLAAAYAPLLRDQVISIGRPEALALATSVREYALELKGDAIAAGISEDLTRLVDEWPSLSDDERGVVRASMKYFLNADDALADDAEGGLVDDEEVVNAAFEALGRSRVTG